MTDNEVISKWLGECRHPDAYVLDVSHHECPDCRQTTKYYTHTRSQDEQTIVEVYTDPARKKLECVYVEEDGLVSVYKNIERTILLDVPYVKEKA
jgi:hypothetical protein